MINPARIELQLTSLPGTKLTKMIPIRANLTRSYKSFAVFSRCFLFTCDDHKAIVHGRQIQWPRTGEDSPGQEQAKREVYFDPFEEEATR